MSYFSFIDKEQSQAWVNGFPQLARAGLTAHGENTKQGLTQGLLGHGEKTKQGIAQGLNHLALGIALGLIVSALILGCAHIIGVYLGSGAPTCAAVGV